MLDPTKDDEPTEGNEDREESWSYENFAAYPKSDQELDFDFDVSP
jgi:hypothetical protein